MILVAESEINSNQRVKQSKNNPESGLNANSYLVPPDGPVLDSWLLVSTAG